MSQAHYYEVNVQWEESRKGMLSSPVLDTSIACATPPEFPGGIPRIWSPEHLYAAAINSCYMATFLAIAENFKLPFTDFSCKTICKLDTVDGRFQITEAVIEPLVTLEDTARDTEKAMKVLEKSKNACLITNSIKTAIILNTNIV